MSSAVTTKPSTSPYTPEAFDRWIAGRKEPAFVSDKRRAAFETYRELLATELDPEEYKRVDLRTFKPDQYQPPAAGETARPAAVATLMQHRAEFAGAIVHVNGRCTESTLDPKLAAKGVLFGDLAELLVTHREKLEPHFMTTGVKVDQDRFSAWHAAYWTGGTVLFVPRNVEVSVPLYSLINQNAAGGAEFTHTLVILEEGASATLLEETASTEEDTDGVHVGAVELLVGAGARLRYVQLQNWNMKTRHFAHQVGRVEKDGMLQWTVAGLGSRMSHVHQHVHLDGQGAHAQVNGVIFATAKQLLSFYTEQSHNAPNTQSDLLYKDVLRDTARVIWRGMIKVEKEAQKTDGYQRNDALLMSADARADSIPGLEIEADDVRCTHGATAGRVDREQLFYCMCRGLSEYEAMHMIVEGFFAGVYDRIPVELVRETLREAVEKKLGIGRV
jgi:Fe-S cluster assembly protein SufD